MLKAIIFDIKKFAIYDGAGIRTTVFFKGCSLDCSWCQNPESKSVRSFLFYDKNKCIDCNKCVEACSLKKISDLKEKRFSSSLECLPDCEDCYKHCSSEAIHKVGKEYTVEELVEIITGDRNFFDISGGGVTLSGGEPLIQIDFVKDLINKLKAKKINILVETAGYVKWDNFNKIMRSVDKFYYDIKIIDEKQHIKYTGFSNKLVMDNLILLNKADNDITIRIPLIPGITDTEKNLIDIIGFINKNGMKKIPVELLPYNQLAETKFNKNGINCDHIGFYFKQGMKTQEKSFLRKRKMLFTDNNIITRILSVD